MTGSDDRFGPDRDPGDSGDPFARFAGGPVEPLPIPEGAFASVRKRAARRRRRRAVLGAAAGAGALAVTGWFVSTLVPGGPGTVVTPQVSTEHHLSTPSPLPSPSTPRPPLSPSASPSAASPSAASPSAAPPTTNSQSPTTVPSAPATASPSSSASTAAGTPLCTADQLTPRLGSGNAGAGQVYVNVVVTNHSATACHVTGFPGLSLLDASGRQIGVPATYTRLPYSPVVLAPGASASDTVHTANRQSNDPAQCWPSSVSLRIYPPGSRASLVFPGQVTICFGTFEVTPFGPGAMGNPAQ